MPQTYINSYVESLQKQIADVASRIKRKNSAKEFADNNDTLQNYGFKLRSDVEVQAYRLVCEETAYTLLGQDEGANSSYATGLYGFISKVDRTSSVIDGLEFENNQQFDFKV